MIAIQPARLISRRAHVLPGLLHVTELFFEVPRNHARPQDGTLTLFGRSVRKHDRPIVPLPASEQANKEKLPYMVYLEGGPGFGNRGPQNHPLTGAALSRGYQVLYLDYRGTGLSTPIGADSVLAQGGPQEQANYLKLFRANSIVRDLEAVRLCLTADFEQEKKPWSIFGQSFGGFTSLTYLSKYPQGLREVFLTGGLAPVKRSPDEVYTATYKKLVERNAAYYKKYPQDVETVHRLADYIRSCDISLPSGGRLTVPLLRTLGISFGGHGGLDEVHSLVLRLATDLDQFTSFTRASLAAFESQIAFDTHPIYAILHEAIYVSKKTGPASNWSADRVAQSLPWFSSTQASVLPNAANQPQSTPPPEALCFTGEMVYPFFFDGSAGPDLARMRDAANILAETSEWDEDLYDEYQLRRNEVPVYALSYIDDMYVDFEFARETAALIRGIKVRETNGWYHDAVRAKADEVYGVLFRMRDDVID